MRFELTVAMRFLGEGRSQTALIVFGVAAGVAVVTYISALVGGLQANTIEKTLGTQPHVSIKALDDAPGRARPAQAGEAVLAEVQPRAQRVRSIDNWGALVPLLEHSADVTAVSPMVSGAGLAVRGQANRAVALVGVEPERYDRIVSLSTRMTAGRFRIAPGEALIGTELAADLGIRVGDPFILAVAGGTTDTLRVAGLFDLGLRDLNRRYVYVGLRAAQSLLGLPGGVTNLDLRVRDPFEADRVALRLREQTGLDAQSWMQTNSQLLAALNAQSVSTGLIRGFVLVIVVLGISSVLVVAVVQKRREIGILRAMGASRAQITRVFLLQGALIGAAGSVAGAGLAWMLLWVFVTFVKGADGRPLFAFTLAPSLLVGVGAIATLCGVLAAALPARRAARLDPAKAIRL